MAHNDNNKVVKSEIGRDLLENPTRRLPVCLVLDTSGSMSGSKIDELNEGVKKFYSEIMGHTIAANSVEIAIVTFGGSANMERDFATADVSTAPRLSAYGGTPLEEAMTIALDALEERKRDIKAAGVDYYQPWVVLMSDGNPDYTPTNSAARCSELVNNKKLTIFSIAIGDDADENVLKMFSPKLPVFRLKGTKFTELFQWLSASAARVSTSRPGESVQFKKEEMEDFFEIDV